MVICHPAVLVYCLVAKDVRRSLYTLARHCPIYIGSRPLHEPVAMLSWCLKGDIVTRRSGCGHHGHRALEREDPVLIWADAGMPFDIRVDR
jgi:hypothetical protein